MSYSVTIRYDDTARIFYVASSDIPGLHAEAASVDELILIIRDVAVDLLPESVGIPVGFHIEGIAVSAA